MLREPKEGVDGLLLVPPRSLRCRRTRARAELTARGGDADRVRACLLLDVVVVAIAHSVKWRGSWAAGFPFCFIQSHRTSVTEEMQIHKRTVTSAKSNLN